MKSKAFRKISLLFALATVLALMVAFCVSVRAQNSDDWTFTYSSEPEIFHAKDILPNQAHVLTFDSTGANGKVQLADGNHPLYIDRLANLPEYALDMYDWLGNNATATGALADVTKATEIADNTYAYVALTQQHTFAYDTRKGETADGVSYAHASQIYDEALQYILAVYGAFDHDRPDVFWLSGDCSTSYSYRASATSPNGQGIGSVTIEISVYFYLYCYEDGFDYYYEDGFDIRAKEYTSARSIAKDMAKRDAAVATILQNTASKSDYQKIRYFNEWLTKNNCYSSNLNSAPDSSWECISALSGRSGVSGPVCEAYARAFQVLCNESDIPCVLVSGANHMWNFVYLQGNWYAVDVTWNDPTVYGVSSATSGYENEKYLLVGSNTVINGETFASEHPVENRVFLEIVGFTNGPVISTTAYEPVLTEVGPDGLVYTINASGTEYSVTGYQGSATEIVILGKYNNLPVTSIADNAFYDCRTLTSITFAEDCNVTSIGVAAFGYCQGLTSMDIPACVDSLGSSAFVWCINMEKITFYSKIIAIGDAAYTVPDNATIYGYKGSTAHAYALKYNRTFVALDGEQPGEDPDDEVTGFLTYTKNQSGNSYSVTGYAGTLTEVVIPSQYEGLPVTGIGADAFRDCESLTAITISNSVTSIGDYAFCSCANLKSIVIPDSVTSIGDCAFCSCDNLKSIVIPDSVTSTGDAVFAISGLTTAVIGAGMDSIPYSFFAECRNLTSITIPRTVTSIGDRAFSDCTSLTAITIPDSVTSLGGYVFTGCKSLESAVVPASVGSIGNGLFNGCEKLKNFIIPAGITSIGNDAFNYCESLDSITIPNGVTEIGGYAFGNCTSLTSVTIPDSVTKLWIGAFFDCKSLTDITFLSADTTIYDISLTISDTATIHGYDDSTAEAYATKYNRTFVSLGASEKPDENEPGGDQEETEQVVRLLTDFAGEGLFHAPGNTPFKVTIWSKQFMGVGTNYNGEHGKLTGGYLELVSESGAGSLRGDNYFRTVFEGMNVNVANPNVYNYPAWFNSTDVKAIQMDVYVSADGLKNASGRSITGGDLYIRVGLATSSTDTWSYGNVAAVQLKSGKNLGGGWYRVTLPLSAFSGNPVLAQLYTMRFDGNAQGNYGVSYTGNFEMRVDNICAVLAADVDMDGEGEEPKPGTAGLIYTLINGGTAYSVTGYTGTATDVIIPSEYGGLPVTAIGDYAFYQCDILTSVKIPSGVTSIGVAAFFNCFDLNSIEIPQGVIRIEEAAFVNCDSLKSIELPSSVTYIGPGAFEGCTSLMSIEIPSGVTSILDWTFGFCEALTSIEIPSSVTSIGEDAFYVCSSLKTITFHSPQAEIYDDADTISPTAAFYGYLGSTAEVYAEKYGRTFVSLGDFQPKINSAKITLGADITVYYTVTLPEQMKDAVMTFKAGSKTATVKGVPTATANRYTFAFEGITPQMMGDNIAVSVIYPHITGGVLKVVSKAEYSVEQYCLNMLEKAKANSLGLSEQKNAALITLLADTLEYGAAAQVYMKHNVDDLVNAGITDQSVFVPLGDEYAAGKPTTTTAADGTRLRGASALLDNTIRLKFKLYAADIDRVCLVIDGVEYSGDDFKGTGEADANGVPCYELVTPAMLATQLDHIYDLSLCVDGVECQTYSYGFVSYLYSMQNNANEAVANMVRATRNYGLSAKAYLGV